MDILDLLRQQEIRPGAPYFSPAHMMQVDRGSFGVPYWIDEFPLQGMFPLTISAPDAPHSVAQYTAQQQIQTAVIGSGSAPTSGIYTGVEDHCG